MGVQKLPAVPLVDFTPGIPISPDFVQALPYGRSYAVVCVISESLEIMTVCRRGSAFMILFSLTGRIPRKER